MRAPAFVFVVGIVGCGNTTATAPQPTGSQTAPAAALTGDAASSTAPGAPSHPSPQPAPHQPVGATCDPAVPAAACARHGGLRVCNAGDPDRVGEWRYAVISPSFNPVEDLALERLTAAWNGDPAAKLELAATAETQAALAAILGPGKAATLDLAQPGARPEVTDKRWAIVPAHELLPHWKVVTVGGTHPLDPAPGPLAVPLCSSSATSPGVALADSRNPARSTKVAVRNIDPARITTIGLTGVTAMTRSMARLMNRKGVLYPLPAVEPWLASVDFAHVSNEVSFVPDCDAGNDGYTMNFCSKESYIELLEKSHVKIVELTGSHLDDYGQKWIPYTLDMYDKRGWMYFGGGRTQIEATTPKPLEHHGNKLVFIGCNMVRTTSKVVSNGPDVAACDLERMGWEIRDYKKRGYLPIVSIQHEEVYRYDPPGELVRDLRLLAESGAAFVMGSQAHSPHPWEIHHGAFVHYGPGNFYFDLGVPVMRDAASDKLYFHAGKLLTVGQLFTRCEEQGRPRLLRDRERAEFMRLMAAAQQKLAKAKPWAPPRSADAGRERPDSLLVRSIVLPFTLRVPAKLEPGTQYPLVVGGSADTAFVVIAKQAKLPPDKLVAHMVAKYPIDPTAITIDGKPYVPPAPASGKRGASR